MAYCVTEDRGFNPIKTSKIVRLLAAKNSVYFLPHASLKLLFLQPVNF